MAEKCCRTPRTNFSNKAGARGAIGKLLVKMHINHVLPVQIYLLILFLGVILNLSEEKKTLCILLKRQQEP